MTITYGPYETERDAAAEPLALEVRDLHYTHDGTTIGRAVRDLELSYLREACTDAGVELGRYDERILTWLANYEPATVQVVIGLISRAHAAGVRQGDDLDQVALNVDTYGDRAPDPDRFRAAAELLREIAAGIRAGEAG